MKMHARLFAFVLCTAVFLPLTQAEIVITGDVSAGTGQLTFTNDINFNITSTEEVLWLAFDEWTTSDGTQNFSLVSLPSDNTALAYSINGGEPDAKVSFLADNSNEPLGDALTANDGLLYFPNSKPAVVVGDTFTVLAGTYNLGFVAGFNSDLNDSSFSGDMFLGGTNGSRISDLGVNVPEPTSLLTFGTIGLLACGRRRKS